MKDAVSSCGYTFLWNLLDYSAGVMPVSHVDAKKDALEAPYRTVLKQLGANGALARGAWKHYDAEDGRKRRCLATWPQSRAHWRNITIPSLERGESTHFLSLTELD
jgi:hypothetical protein